jgi:hypothetical protein
MLSTVLCPASTCRLDRQLLCEAVRRKRRDQWQLQRNGFCITTTRRATHRLLRTNSPAGIAQPPHSPDLAPSDPWLFPALKTGLKGARFSTVEGIKKNETVEIRRIPKEASAGAANSAHTQWSYFEDDW